MHELWRTTILLLSFLPMVTACGKQNGPQQDAIRHLEATQRKIAALPSECTLGPPSLATQAGWLSSTKAMPASGMGGGGIVNVFSLDKPVTARALRVALDLQALRDIEKVETRDAQGNWSDAGPISRAEAPVACEYVWLQQELPAARQVEALRFSFRQEPGTMTVSSPGVLQ